MASSAARTTATAGRHGAMGAAGAAPSTPGDRRRRRRRCLLAAGLFVVAMAAWGSRRAPMGPDAGSSFSAASSYSEANRRLTLRLATWNIHSGKGSDGRVELQQTARTLAGFDLVGLNEVRGTAISGSLDQVQWLGNRLGMAWLFAPTEERWWHQQFGNGVLAGVPVKHWQRVPLPRRYGKSFRNLVLLAIEFEGRTLHVVVTHVDRSDIRERDEQLQLAANLFLSLAEPAVLMGDMNTEASEPVMARLLAAPGVRDPVEEVLGDEAPRRIDWILTRGLRTIDAGVRESDASDHPLIWVEVAAEGA